MTPETELPGTAPHQFTPPQKGVTSLIFPSYNPGPGLERTLEAVEAFAASANRRWEFLFVSDGSDDRSDERLMKWAEDRGDMVRVLAYPKNRGKGYAVRLGLLEAVGQWRIFTDVDLAYSFDDVLRLARRLWSGADAVIASRTHPEARIQLPLRHLGYVFARHVQSQVFSKLVRSLLPILAHDTQAGLKGLSATTVQRVVPHLRSDGFAFDCELLTACARMGIRVEEAPVCVTYEAPTSTVPRLAAWQMLYSLWSIRRMWPVGATPAVHAESAGVTPLVAANRAA